jgi:hypothetical protein
MQKEIDELMQALLLAAADDGFIAGLNGNLSGANPWLGPKGSEDLANAWESGRVLGSVGIVPPSPATGYL